MTEFLVKRRGPAAVRVLAGSSAVTFRVREGGTRRVTIPARLVPHIDPAHAKHLVALALPAPAGGDFEITEDDGETMPASPQGMRKINVEG